MKLEEMKEYIGKIKNEIEEAMQSSSENKEIELVKIIKRPGIEKIIARDSQLLAFEYICKIWIAEKTYGYAETILSNIHSLGELEELYTNLKYYCRRFEYDAMPDEELQEGIWFIVNNRISAVALFGIVEEVTRKKEENLLRLAQFLKIEGQLIMAAVLLQQAVNKYEKNEELIIELADCWLEAQQWQRAYDTLKKIEKPSKDIEEIILNLEEVLGDENS